MTEKTNAQKNNGEIQAMSNEKIDFSAFRQNGTASTKKDQWEQSLSSSPAVVGKIERLFSQLPEGLENSVNTRFLTDYLRSEKYQPKIDIPTSDLETDVALYAVFHTSAFKEKIIRATKVGGKWAYFKPTSEEQRKIANGEIKVK